MVSPMERIVASTPLAAFFDNTITKDYISELAQQIARTTVTTFIDRAHEEGFTQNLDIPEVLTDAVVVQVYTQLLSTNAPLFLHVMITEKKAAIQAVYEQYELEIKNSVKVVAKNAQAVAVANRRLNFIHQVLIYIQHNEWEAMLELVKNTKQQSK
jgi:hypothetical protein